MKADVTLAPEFANGVMSTPGTSALKTVRGVPARGLVSAHR